MREEEVGIIKPKVPPIEGMTDSLAVTEVVNRWSSCRRNTKHNIPTTVKEYAEALVRKYGSFMGGYVRNCDANHIKTLKRMDTQPEEQARAPLAAYRKRTRALTERSRYGDTTVLKSDASLLSQLINRIEAVGEVISARERRMNSEKSRLEGQRQRCIWKRLEEERKLRQMVALGVVAPPSNKVSSQEKSRIDSILAITVDDRIAHLKDHYTYFRHHKLSEKDQTLSARLQREAVSRRSIVRALNNNSKLDSGSVTEMLRAKEAAKQATAEGAETPDLARQCSNSRAGVSLARLSTLETCGFVGLPPPRVPGLQNVEAKGHNEKLSEAMEKKTRKSVWVQKIKVGFRTAVGKALECNNQSKGENEKAQADNSPNPKNRGCKGSAVELLADTVRLSSLKQKLRREACESIRILVFGAVGNETWRSREKEKVFDEHVGTKREVREVVKLWTKLDKDVSGFVDATGFLSFFNRTDVDKLLGWKAMQYLVGETGSRVCYVEDIMQLIWLKAEERDIKQMMIWFKEVHEMQKRVPTPPLRSRRHNMELLENFRYIDSDKQGRITYQELLDTGLVDPDMIPGVSGDGEIDRLEFLEMMCPCGYRAHPAARRAFDTEGNPVVFVQNQYFTGWMLDQN